ncbi:MAG TPA: SDR family oxidoreductase [Polyangia bacterium]|jgi:2-deoxy-D-gluconate 3-dehydrogenase
MPTDLFRLDGQRALVTGAGTGIGAALALALAEAGADVACHGNKHAPVETAARVEALGRRAAVVAGDLADGAVAAGLVEKAAAGLGGDVDILVNNAGIIRRAPAADSTDADWDAVLAVNLTAVYKLCRAAGPRMLARGRGKIVNISSLLAFQGGITVPSYAASKGAVAQLTKALANEWAGRGVNVNAIAPGYIRTDNTAALAADATRNRQILERIPAGRWGDPGDLGGAIVFLASRASDYVSGHVLVVDGGWMGR